jgi:hypothetical protein
MNTKKSRRFSGRVPRGTVAWTGESFDALSGQESVMKKFLLSTTGLVVFGASVLMLVGICWATNCFTGYLGLNTAYWLAVYSDNIYDPYGDNLRWHENTIQIRTDMDNYQVAFFWESSLCPDINYVQIVTNGSTHDVYDAYYYPDDPVSTPFFTTYASQGAHNVLVRTYQPADVEFTPAVISIKEGSQTQNLGLKKFIGWTCWGD